jgi:amidase
VSTFITPMDEGTGRQRVAVKDLLDLRGIPTTAGSRAVARRAVPAVRDAACLAGLRAAVDAGTARIVGKANLHELAAGATGINPWFGTPRHPIDVRLVPGGSSSGSAVSVASHEADVAIGTDTAGSIRIPAACCGVVGLKTTYGRIDTAGVWALAPSLDTVGPMARDVEGVVAGMRLLEAGFAPGDEPPGAVGRLRLSADPRIEAAIDRCLRVAELTVADVRLDGWAAAGDATLTVVVVEAWAADGHLIGDDGVGSDLRDALGAGRSMPAAAATAARTLLGAWRRTLVELVARVGPLVMPTIVDRPPRLTEGDPDGRLLLATAPINGAGLPSLALPVPGPGPVPVSLQIVGGPGGEEQLVALGRRIEAAAASIGR